MASARAVVRALSCQTVKEIYVVSVVKYVGVMPLAIVIAAVVIIVLRVITLIDKSVSHQQTLYRRDTFRFCITTKIWLLFRFL